MQKIFSGESTAAAFFAYFFHLLELAKHNHEFL